MIKLHKAGEARAKELIAHGKVNDKPWSFDAADRDELLGPKGSDVRELARHHLGEDDSRTESDPKRYRYPIAKEGEVSKRALRSVADRADENGHDEVRDSAEGLIGLIELGGGDTDKDAATGEQGEKDRSRPRPSRREVVEEGDKWYVKSEDGEKNLGGPYDTEEEAKKRLMEIEYFKHKNEHSSPRDGVERRCLMAGIELRSAAGGGNSPGTCVGYAAVFERFSDDLGYFREKIAPGAFAGCIGQDVRALANHDPNLLLGRTKTGTCRISEDGLGLRTEIDLPDTDVGRSVAELVRRGDMDGMSFSFIAEVDQWDYSAEVPVRTLIKVRDLYDVGPVTFPAYTDTSVAMRSLDAQRPAPTPDPDVRLHESLWHRQRLAEATLLPS